MGNFALTSAGSGPSPSRARQDVSAKRKVIICDGCDFDSELMRSGFCPRISVIHISEAAIRNPQLRLECQHYLVDQDLPYRQIADWLADIIRDFNGHYRHENGEAAPVPSFECILTDGSDWWFRELLSVGKWQAICDVPKLRREAIERWRLIATVLEIERTQPIICF